MFSKKRIQQLFMATVLTFAACAPLAAQPGQTLEGAWLISITVDGATAPFAIDMAIFDVKGSYRIIPSDKGESEGVGSYQRTGSREFRSTHTQILYNAQGAFAGVAKVIAVEKVNDAGDALTGRYRLDILDVSGQIMMRITGTIAGKLVLPEPL